MDFYQCHSTTCQNPTVTARICHGLWRYRVSAAPPTSSIDDEITGIGIEFKCAMPSFNVTASGNLDPKMVNGNPLHATRGELLGRLGRFEEAREAFARALALAGDASEQRLLRRRLRVLDR
jgi:hypothetical protein